MGYTVTTSTNHLNHPPHNSPPTTSQTGGGPCLRIRFADLEPLTPMTAIKSGVVGRFISVKGTVARCSAVRPLVLGARFQCPKCSELMGWLI